MIRTTLIALFAGILFGGGLAVSGMADPARVRGFLDLSGHWDPTLAFVMLGAIIPMAVAWRVAATRIAPIAASAFHIPSTRSIDATLIGGAAIFGIGWGLVGLCPGPAIAALALRPFPALLFVLAMFAGALVHRFAFPPAPTAKAAD